MSTPFVTHWEFFYKFSVMDENQKNYISNQLSFLDEYMMNCCLISGNNITECVRILRGNNGNNIELWNSGTIESTILQLPPWMTQEEIDKYQREGRYTMTGNTFIPFIISPSENGYFDFVCEEENVYDNPFYWTIYSEIYEGVTTGNKSFQEIAPKSGIFTLSTFPNYTYRFIDLSGCPISHVSYIYSGHNGSTVINGNTSTDTILSGIPGTVSWFKAIRNGFLPTVITGPQYVATQTSSNTPKNGITNKFNLTLSGNGEVASNYRIDETFQTNIHAVLPYNENYSRLQQKEAVSGDSWVYSTIASQQNNLTLRLEDYLRIKTNADVIEEEFNSIPWTQTGTTTVGFDGENTECLFIGPALSSYTTNGSIILYTTTTAQTMTVPVFGTIANQPQTAITYSSTTQNNNNINVVVQIPNNTLEPGFPFIRSSSPQYNPTGKHTIIGHNIVSGIVGQLNGIAATKIGLITPPLNITISAATQSWFHNTLYLSGDVKISLFDVTENVEKAALSYDVKVDYTWVTSNNDQYNITPSRTEVYNDELTLHLLSASSLNQSHTYQLRLVSDLREIIVHGACCFYLTTNYGYNYKTYEWTCGVTYSHVTIPQTTITYGYY